MTRLDKIGLQASALGGWTGITPGPGGIPQPAAAARALRAWGGAAGRRAASLGGLAVISAVLSDLTCGWVDRPYPVLPGIYFGLVLVAGVSLWGTSGKRALLAVFGATNLAWWCAFQATLTLYPYLQDVSAVPAALCGVASGLIGSFVTACAIAYASPDFRTRANWSRTLAVGGLAGILLQCVDIGSGSELPVLLAWQAAVAASIGYGLAAPRAAGKA